MTPTSSTAAKTSTCASDTSAILDLNPSYCPAQAFTSYPFLTGKRDKDGQPQVVWVERERLSPEQQRATAAAMRALAANLYGHANALLAQRAGVARW